MTITRRDGLFWTAAALTAGTPALAQDGVGPNRGVVSHVRRRITCDNSAVPVSDGAARLTQPADFVGDACRMIRDSHEGPYFTCTPAPGRDITAGETGQPLTVAFRLVDGACTPIPGGVVDIWACNATGHYSGYAADPNKSPPLLRTILFGHIRPDREHRFCRGALKTDADGIAEFDTIYPGFYYGQPIHIHFKAHVAGQNLLTSQANLPEGWNTRIMQTAPYNAPRPVKRNTKDTSFPKMRILERGDRLVAVLDLVVPT